jgi:PAS domain S-box-containing protein
MLYAQDSAFWHHFAVKKVRERKGFSEDGDSLQFSLFVCIQERSKAMVERMTTEPKWAKDEIKRLSKEFKQRVIERTGELLESGERDLSLLESSPDPIVVYDMEGRATYVNPAFAKTFGWSPEELLGKRIDYVPKENWPETKAALERMLRGEKIQSFETRRSTKNGEVLDIQLSFSLFYGQGGEPAGNIVILRDVTEQKRAEAALRESEAKYRLLIDNLPSIVYRGYKDWSVDFMDQKIKSLTGYAMEEFNSRQKRWSDVIVDKDLETVREAFIQALKTNKSYVREYRIKTKAGEILWIQDRGYIVCNKDGEIEYVSGVFFDVTDRKRLERAIIQREKLNTLGAIAAEVAHEIRNPLVSLGGFARRLQQKFPHLVECNIILQETQRLEKILSRIRNYLKPVEVHPQQCSVNTIITDCVDLLSPETERRRVACQLDLAPRLSVVSVDPDILTQIFINLILNAAEAMDQGETLFIKSFESERDLYIEVKNPAPSLEVKHPELLFMPFAEGGESIGLPLCYRLLKNMGGQLTFTLEKNYTVFRVSLPKTVQP